MKKLLFVFVALMGVATTGWPVIRSKVNLGVTGTSATEITGRDGAPMMLIPAGEFMMGSEKDGQKPIHRVSLDAYYLDKFEVTFARYDAFCDATGRAKPPDTRSGHQSNSKPSDKGWGRDKRPVIWISWLDAKAYCEWAGKRLPTEAEWESACRAGSVATYCFGEDQGLLGSYAWYKTNSGGMTHPVGTKKPNGLGLYDMHGNVWEWCADWYSGGYYAVSQLNNPKGPSSGEYRMMRGGSWFFDYDRLGSTVRFFNEPDFRDSNTGCRCAKTL